MADDSAPVPHVVLSYARSMEWEPTGETIEADEADQTRPITAERRLLCMIVRQLTEELLRATGLENDGDPGRRATSHVRQVAMYVCHVAYSMPMGEVAQAFGRDRSTVGHACRMVEDRRDDRAYDTFVAIVERMASAVHLLAGYRI
ncbi:MAG: helix-turn-helix domain-containing protein [Pseudomonadota bacterium]|nr:helix-turn-helix domain-containing protein [Pseudomonadota bacterium]